MPVAVLGLAQGAADDPLRALRRARGHPARLHQHRAGQGPGREVTILKHVVRNALIPVVTLVALQIPGIFTGAVITEQIFRVPGIGSLLITSILANDTPVIMAHHLRVLVPGGALQPGRGPALRLARSAHLVPLSRWPAPNGVASEAAPARSAGARAPRDAIALERGLAPLPQAPPRHASGRSSSLVMVVAVAGRTLRLPGARSTRSTSRPS